MIEPQFDYARDFDPDGLAMVDKDGETYHINANGETVIPEASETSEAPEEEQEIKNG